jgi:hypothetical protein
MKIQHEAESYDIRGRDGSITKISDEIMPRSFLTVFVGRLLSWLRAWSNPYRPNSLDDYKADYVKPTKPSGTSNEPGQSDTGPDQNLKPKRVFCTLFDFEGPDQNGFALADLGLAMGVETRASSGVAGDSSIPGGYTYLGQFINHDITATPGDVKLDFTGKKGPDNIPNERTPKLDLDCLYGLGRLEMRSYLRSNWRI